MRFHFGATEDRRPIVNLSEDEIETIRNLIKDWGWEYALMADPKKVAELARKLGLEKLARDLEV